MRGTFQFHGVPAQALRPCVLWSDAMQCVVLVSGLRAYFEAALQIPECHKVRSNSVCLHWCDRDRVCLSRHTVIPRLRGVVSVVGGVGDWACVRGRG